MFIRQRNRKKATPSKVTDVLEVERYKKKARFFRLAQVILIVQLCPLIWFWCRLSRPLQPYSHSGDVLTLAKKSFPSDGIDVMLKSYSSSNDVRNDGSSDSGDDAVEYYRVDIVTACPNAAVYAYLTKDALVYVKLTEQSPKHWSGTFSCPAVGEYELRVRSSGCGDEGGGSSSSESNMVDLPVIEFHHKVDTANHFFENNSVNFPGGLVSKAAWFFSWKVRIDTSTKQPPAYVWMNPTVVRDETQVKGIEGPNEGFVSEKGSVMEKGFFEFKQLSNYELVCFFGSESAKDLHSSLLSLRGALFPYQRPFKFHYYEMNDLDHPDEGWTQETKKGFRKCKHVLVSMDEPKTPLSQTDYKTKMITLINHLTAAFDDTTFPLIIFTSMESLLNPKNCYNPVGARTTDHPCNTVLKEIFSHSPASSRVRLLDNTDLTYPLVSGYKLRSDALLSIALRIFIIVGYQVEEWRANNQLGHIDGLTRGDKEYPNFELVPFDWTSTVSSKTVNWINKE